MQIVACDDWRRIMTIAIAIKVHDGIVLATDSAVTLNGIPVGPPIGLPTVVNVYNNGNKVFNLRKGLPIGVMFWGVGSIGKSSVSTLTKDLRRRFSGADSARKDWHLDPDNYAIEDVAKRTREFFFDELYTPAYAAVPAAQRPIMGLMVAGYSTGKSLAEAWQILIRDGQCDVPTSTFPNTDEGGAFWSGDPEVVNRIVLGYGTALGAALESIGTPKDQVGPALAKIAQSLHVPLITAPMPIQDVIELADFLATAAIMFARFRPGHATVGGPVEIAAITKHEGFKWVKRKHYFGHKLNPSHFEEEDRHG